MQRFLVLGSGTISKTNDDGKILLNSMSGYASYWALEWECAYFVPPATKTTSWTLCRAMRVTGHWSETMHTTSHQDVQCSFCYTMVCVDLTCISVLGTAIETVSVKESNMRQNGSSPHTACTCTTYSRRSVRCLSRLIWSMKKFWAKQGTMYISNLRRRRNCAFFFVGDTTTRQTRWLLNVITS